MIRKYSINDIEANLISSVLEVDSLAFAEDFQGTYSEEYDRFIANKDTYVFLYDGAKMVGYLNLFPIKRELYEQIISEDRLFDSDIPGEMIEQYVPSRSYDLYLLSAAIRPDYQKRGLSKLLVKGFFEYLLEKKNDGILFSSALSTAVTNEGSLLLERMGFGRKKDITGGHGLYELIIDGAVYRRAEDYVNGI